MEILLTNDDGIYAEGLTKLLEILQPLGHKLIIVAPLKNNSGAGHGITLWREIEIRKIDPFAGTTECWYVDGTPVDAVKFALGNEISHPDLVVSGINNGPNMGNTIFYSGTVGAALEALFHNISSVALSVENWSEPLWEPAIHFGRKIVELALPLAVTRVKEGKPAFLLNVNFPDVPTCDIQGIRLTRQGSSGFQERFYPSQGGTPHHYFLAGEFTHPDVDDDIDTTAVKQGYISITPLDWRITNHVDIAVFSEIFT